MPHKEPKLGAESPRILQGEKHSGQRATKEQRVSREIWDGTGLCWPDGGEQAHHLIGGAAPAAV